MKLQNVLFCEYYLMFMINTFLDTKIKELDSLIIKICFLVL